jgi:phosphate:Na+ symporter
MNSWVIILVNFAAGTASLMYGVHLMSHGLEKMNSRWMEKLLKVFTGNVFSAFAAGTLVTALVQSSTAVTVITVGLVNSGLLRLAQAVGIIYGANIGTTITAQLMSFHVTSLGLPVLAAGLACRFLAKKRTLLYFGQALMGFGLLFVGLGILNSGVPHIRESEFASRLFQAYGNNPLLGLLLGMTTTMLVQSSSATVGLTIVLFNSGFISFEAALGLTLGDNIGTCITAQLASLGTGISARRTAWAHTLYNCIGVLLALIFFTPFTSLVKQVTVFLGQDTTRLVANTHTVFNLLSAVVFLPMTRYYVRFLEWVIPGRN